MVKQFKDPNKTLADWCARMKEGPIRFNLDDLRAPALRDAGLIRAVDNDWGRLTKEGSDALAQYWAHEAEEKRRSSLTPDKGA